MSGLGRFEFVLFVISRGEGWGEIPLDNCNNIMAG